MLQTIHVFHGNIGGAGKTLCAALFADYCKRQSLKVRCFDSDNTGADLSHYPSLQVQCIRGIDLYSGNTINFDPVFESTAERSILDCGPVGYHAFLRYIRENRLDQDHRWVLHVPVTGTRLDEAKDGFERLKVMWPPFVVLWLNPYQHGPFTFEETAADLGLPNDAAILMVSLAGWEFKCLETALNSNTRRMTLSEIVEFSCGMSRLRLQRCRDVLDDRLKQLCIG